jgi:hypothetical protein
LDDDPLIRLSPRHYVRLAPEIVAVIDRPQRSDVVIRTIRRKEANGLPLMAGEIVVAGRETRRAFPLAETYPIHFKKTYFPGRLHGDPGIELARHQEASEIIDIPPPIGCDERSFRACLLPGRPLDALSPFHGEPEDIRLRQARELSLDAAAGQWRLTETAFETMQRLHERGLVHGDAVLQNFIVCPSPLEILPIDFEAARRRDELDELSWQRSVQSDLDPLLLHAVFLLCTLGVQPSPLAEAALARMDRLLRSPERFRHEIERRSELEA